MSLLEIEKELQQEGRIPPHAVARTEFCYHSLQGVFLVIAPFRLLGKCQQGKRYLTTPISATCSE
jgi:hypothetical protein